MLYDYVKDIIEGQSLVVFVHIPGYIYIRSMILSAVSRLETCDLFSMQDGSIQLFGLKENN